MFRGVLVFWGVPVLRGVPLFRCSSVPGFFVVLVFRDVPKCSRVFRGIPVFRGVPVFQGVPLFR